MTKLAKLVFLLFTFLSPALAMAQTPALTIGEAKVDDFGLNKLLYRWHPNGGLLIDTSGMCFEMSLTYNAKDMVGSRVFCLVSALDKDGNELADRTGVCASLAAQNVSSQNANGTFRFVMPQGWLVNTANREAGSIRLFAQVFSLEDGGPKAEKEFTLTGDALKIDNRNLPGKLMGDLFGGSESDAMGNLIDGLFGGPTASSTQPCPACDGTRLCQNCDGDGYFDPSSCRKCTAAPGICRRCKGEGKVTIKVDVHDSWF